MPIRTRSIPSGYVTACKARSLTGIGMYGLLRLIACGLVRVEVLPGFYPLYCIADVRKNINAVPGRHKPTAKTRKGHKVAS